MTIAEIILLRAGEGRLRRQVSEIENGSFAFLFRPKIR